MNNNVPIFLVFSYDSEDCDLIFCDLLEERATAFLEKVESERKPFGVTGYKLRVAETGTKLDYKSMLTLEQYHTLKKFEQLHGNEIRGDKV